MSRYPSLIQLMTDFPYDTYKMNKSYNSAGHTGIAGSRSTSIMDRTTETTKLFHNMGMSFNQGEAFMANCAS